VGEARKTPERGRREAKTGGLPEERRGFGRKRREEKGFPGGGEQSFSRQNDGDRPEKINYMGSNI